MLCYEFTRGISVARAASRRRDVHRRIAAILTFTLIPVAGWSAGEWHGSTPITHLTTPVPVLPSSSPVSNSSSTNEGLSTLPSPLIEEPAAGQQKDIYGNDISSAIAQYKSDGSGVVYEEHSPNTEVARLKPPTT